MNAILQQIYLILTRRFLNSSPRMFCPPSPEMSVTAAQCACAGSCIWRYRVGKDRAKIETKFWRPWTVLSQQAHNIKMTSNQRRCDVVASTLIRRHFNVVCPLGYPAWNWFFLAGILVESSSKWKSRFSNSSRLLGKYCCWTDPCRPEKRRNQIFAKLTMSRNSTSITKRMNVRSFLWRMLTKIIHWRISQIATFWKYTHKSSK